MTVDPFGRAILDHHRGEREEPLLQRDGEETLHHPIQEFYFSEDAAEDDALIEWVDGPVLDLGAGAGRHALVFQTRYDVVAIESSDHLVETMRARGVEDARSGDMFALREAFDRDRFRSAIAIGTQLGLAGSMQGLRAFLGDLRHVTTADATAVVDCYDPEQEGSMELLGYRADPTPGLATRVMQFEYEGTLGRPLVFRLFGPDRLREATVGTGWSVERVERNGDTGHHYRAYLAKA